MHSRRDLIRFGIGMSLKEYENRKGPIESIVVGVPVHLMDVNSRSASVIYKHGESVSEGTVPLSNFIISGRIYPLIKGEASKQPYIPR